MSSNPRSFRKGSDPERISFRIGIRFPFRKGMLAWVVPWCSEGSSVSEPTRTRHVKDSNRSLQRTTSSTSRVVFLDPSPANLFDLKRKGRATGFRRLRLDLSRLSPRLDRFKPGVGSSRVTKDERDKKGWDPVEEEQLDVLLFEKLFLEVEERRAER